MMPSHVPLDIVEEAAEEAFFISDLKGQVTGTSTWENAPKQQKEYFRLMVAASLAKVWGKVQARSMTDDLNKLVEPMMLPGSDYPIQAIAKAHLLDYFKQLKES